MDTVFANPGHLGSALEIIQSRDAIRKELRKRLTLAVRARLPDGWSIHRDLTVHPDFGLKMPGSAGWQFPGGGQESDWWPYWRRFRGLGEHEPKEYADWELSAQPWIDMDNGKMAHHFVSLAERIYAALGMKQ
jgi:hypothetical protein